MPRELGSGLTRALSAVSLASCYGAGILGIPVVVYLGAPLAMMARMYGGELEPSEPRVPWPTLVTLIVAALPVPAVATGRWKLAVIASVPFALLPWVQLLRLYQAAAER